MPPHAVPKPRHPLSNDHSRLDEARFSDGQRFLLWCLFVGLLCGLAAVGFHWGIHSLFTTLWNFASKLPTPWFATVMIVAPSFGD
ncbi:MAG: hypothetical protein R3F31_27695 [Verrucomicrobiales bacterium]